MVTGCPTRRTWSGRCSRGAVEWCPGNQPSYPNGRHEQPEPRSADQDLPCGGGDLPHPTSEAGNGQARRTDTSSPNRRVGGQIRWKTVEGKRGDSMWHAKRRKREGAAKHFEGPARQGYGPRATGETRPWPATEHGHTLPCPMKSPTRGCRELPEDHRGRQTKLWRQDRRHEQSPTVLCGRLGRSLLGSRSGSSPHSHRYDCAPKVQYGGYGGPRKRVRAE